MTPTKTKAYFQQIDLKYNIFQFHTIPFCTLRAESTSRLQAISQFQLHWSILWYIRWYSHHIESYRIFHLEMQTDTLQCSLDEYKMWQKNRFWRRGLETEKIDITLLLTVLRDFKCNLKWFDGDSIQRRTDFVQFHTVMDVITKQVNNQVII